MKISELILELEKIKEKEGDLKVLALPAHAEHITDVEIEDLEISRKFLTGNSCLIIWGEDIYEY